MPKSFTYSLKCLFVLSLGLVLSSCAGNKQKISISNDEIEIFEEFGVDPDVKDNFKRAVKLISQQQYKDAIRLLLQVTSKTDKHSAPYVNLGIAYSHIEEIDEAEKSFLTALKINPVHPVTLNELAMVYRKTGRFSEAKKTYEKILDKYPQFLPARKNIGILCDIFIQDLDCAIEHYQAFLEIQPADEKMKIWLADLKNRAEN